ncbi:hypothetical protein FACUT_10275 [Fusarium acutatum]|uniref:Uncharacterized protein n=1 Tax=Fusarium acutatum TaxID=78861 RepID=A0A8H4JGU3_9HYPO|nr:hypothetical protein FACUT_10275 [Fusarium acutatum]
MAQRVADIDDWVRMPYLISTTQNRFYENYPAQAFGTGRTLNRPDPAPMVNAQPVGYFCNPQDNTSVRLMAHTRRATGYMREPHVSSVEDMIYYRAKEQRYKNDAERRIQDWIRLMPELVGNSKTSSSTHRISKRCTRNNNKEDKNQGLHKDKKKEKNKEDGSKRNKRHTFTRRFH